MNAIQSIESMISIAENELAISKKNLEEAKDAAYSAYLKMREENSFSSKDYDIACSKRDELKDAESDAEGHLNTLISQKREMELQTEEYKAKKDAEKQMSIIRLLVIAFAIYGFFQFLIKL